MALKIQPLTIVKGIGALGAAVAAPFTGGATVPAAIGLTASTAADVAQAKMVDDAQQAAKKQANVNLASSTPPPPVAPSPISTAKGLAPIGTPSDSTIAAGNMSAGQIIDPNQPLIQSTEPKPAIAPTIDQKSAPETTKLDAKAQAAQDEKDKTARAKAAGVVTGGISKGINSYLDTVGEANKQARSTFDTIFSGGSKPMQSAPPVNIGSIGSVSQGNAPQVAMAPMLPPVQNPTFGPDPNEELKKQLAMSDRTKKTQIKSANQELKHFLNLIYRGNHGR